MRALQVVVLMMMMPQLWAYALPGTLARDTSTPQWRHRLSRRRHTGVTQVITRCLRAGFTTSGHACGAIPFRNCSRST